MFNEDFSGEEKMGWILTELLWMGQGRCHFSFFASDTAHFSKTFLEKTRG